jgi:hypothetical protein
MSIPVRQIDQYLWDKELIGSKMVFLAGPRQIGKTTYARSLLSGPEKGAYFNWDNPEVRREFAKDTFFFLQRYKGGKSYLVVFDEIHKRFRWKDILKGIYDSVDRSVRIFVTGSARLELFRKSGDSLVGRYSLFRMLPLSCAEITGRKISSQWPFCGSSGAMLLKKLDDSVVSPELSQAQDQLIRFGGFPEPFLKGSERFLNKWKMDYLSLLLTGDLTDLTNIKDVDRVERLVELLPERIASPLSLNSLAGDLQSNQHTVASHCMQLERLWLIFFVRPYSTQLKRTLTKEPKCYFVNWEFAKDDGKRFENFIAVHLFRLCAVANDFGIGDFRLWYVRNFDGGEIDFCVTRDKVPLVCVEAKLSDVDVSQSARTFAQRLKTPLVQVVRRPGIHKKIASDIVVVSAEKLLSVIP